MADKRRLLRPTDVVRIFNSTPLGRVVSTSMLRRHRNDAGLRIGTTTGVDLVRYVAWLVGEYQRRRSAAGQGAASVPELWGIAPVRMEAQPENQEAYRSALLLAPARLGPERKRGEDERARHED